MNLDVALIALAYVFSFPQREVDAVNPLRAKI
jgi:hypothetical protein